MGFAVTGEAADAQEAEPEAQERLGGAAAEEAGPLARARLDGGNMDAVTEADAGAEDAGAGAAEVA